MSKGKCPEKRAKNFLKSRNTLRLATVGKNSRCPTASHAPFILDENDLYVYVSALSKHTQEMKDNCEVSAVIVEDEINAKFRLFEMKRMTFSCTAVIVDRGTVEWNKVMDLFDKRFGKSFKQVKPLRDFTLFCLRPHDVFYVEGFGKAYRMDWQLKGATHVRGTGPGAEAHSGNPIEQRH